MKFIPTLLLALVACGTMATPLAAADLEKNISLPVLTVSGQQPIGTCRRLKFRFARDRGDRTPLSMAVVEDTPGGAGESIRASMWLAAMVAALDRQDDLSGVRVSLELSGQIDGPSAGAGVCLAILSALDDREYPDDCAVTGTIMPDGTIGGVGAIAAKIKGAAKAGIRRVLIPAYLRFEQDVASGEEVDLKQLAASLQVELIPVENIANAYLILHRDVPKAKTPPARTVLELPTATEEVFKSRFQEHRRAGTEIWQAIPAAEREQITANSYLKSMFVDELANSERAYRSGRLTYAVTAIWGWRLALQARQANIESLRQLQPEDFEKQNVAGALGQLDAILNRNLQALPEFGALVADNRANWSESAAQFYTDYYSIFGIVGMNSLFQQGQDALTTELAKPELKPEERKEHFQSLLELKVLQLFAARCALDAAHSWQAEIDAVAKTLPRRGVTDDVVAVERLFYSAHRAVHNSFEHDVVRQTAIVLQLSDKDALAALVARDTTLAMHLRPAEAATQFHREWAGLADPSRRRFAAAASAHLQAECLGVMSGLMARWTELEVEITDDGEFRYGRTDLLNYLLTAARENALEAIAECRRLEIACVGALNHFEAGELSRDDADADKVDVLTSYWTASLQAKVLLMLCGDTKNEAMPPAMVPVGAPSTSRPAVPAAPMPVAPSSMTGPSSLGPAGTAKVPRLPTSSSPLQSGRPQLMGQSPIDQRQLLGVPRLPPQQPIRHVLPQQKAINQDNWPYFLVILAVSAWLRKIFGSAKKETTTDGTPVSDPKREP